MKFILSFLALLALALPALAQDATIASAEVYTYAGVPSSGTSEIDTITLTGTGGSFTITVSGGRTTAAINHSATTGTMVSNIDTALENLSAIGTGGVTTAAGSLTSGTGTVTVTFAGKNAKKDMPALTVTSSLTTGSAAIATTTAGVDATFREARPGTILIDTVTPDAYVNTSTTAFSPTWKQLSQVGGKAGLGQVVVDGTSIKAYTTGTSGIFITGTGASAVSTF